MNEIKKRAQLPWWEKYTLSVEEASEYFGIGDKVLRRFLKEHQDADFVISNGVKILIKRKKFEEYIDEFVSAV